MSQLRASEIIIWRDGLHILHSRAVAINWNIYRYCYQYYPHLEQKSSNYDSSIDYIDSD